MAKGTQAKLTYIGLWATRGERALLERLRDDSKAGTLSAAMRALVRQAAAERGVDVGTVPTVPAPRRRKVA